MEPRGCSYLELLRTPLSCRRHPSPLLKILWAFSLSSNPQGRTKWPEYIPRDPMGGLEVPVCQGVGVWRMWLSLCMRQGICLCTPATPHGAGGSRAESAGRPEPRRATIFWQVSLKTWIILHSNLAFQVMMRVSPQKTGGYNYFINHWLAWFITAKHLCTWAIKMRGQPAPNHLCSLYWVPSSLSFTKISLTSPLSPLLLPWLQAWPSISFLTSVPLNGILEIQIWPSFPRSSRIRNKKSRQTSHQLPL